MKLLIYRGDTLERTLELSARDFRIGRAAENDVVLEDPEKTVSRFHAELRYENGAYALIDLNSQNGTWIEGERVRRTALGAGQAAVMGNFRIAIEDLPTGLGAVPAVQPDTLSGEMPQTLAMPRDAADALVAEANAAAAGVPADAAPVTPIATTPVAAAVPAPAVKRPPSPPAAGGAKTGLASIPRPIFYGGAFVFLLLIVGVMYVMRPHGGPPPDQAGVQEGVGVESNAQIVARHVKEGRDKLDAGDTQAAIDAASRALLVDPNSADALDLKVKAEERKRQALANAATTPGGTATPDPSSATPGSAAPGSTAPGSTTPGTTPSTPTASTTPGGTTPSTTTASTGPTTPAKPGTPPGPTKAQQRRDATKRDQDISKRYQAAKVALTRGDYAEAVSGFDSVVKERPGYLDAASMLDQARGHIRTQAQQTTQQAAELAAKGEYAAALQQYERARRLDPNLAGVEQGVANVRRQMKEAGDDAFKRARQLDAVGRAQAALPLYEKAVSLLSADDANAKAARERLDALKARNP